MFGRSSGSAEGEVEVKVSIGSEEEVTCRRIYISSEKDGRDAEYVNM
jgi:hypothetical protein